VTRSRPALVVLLAVLGLGLGLVVVRLGEDRPPTEAAAERVAAPRIVDVAAAEVLRGWDEQRAAAYAAGSVRRLRQLYVAGSVAARSDVRVLRGYRSRGLVVEGMRTQVLALRVVEQRPRRLRLEVTDRLAAAVAVGPGRRTELPRDQPDTRVVTLRRGADGAWRVSAVLPVR
jgi:hypothetical protein